MLSLHKIFEAKKQAIFVGCRGQKKRAKKSAAKISTF